MKHDAYIAGITLFAGTLLLSLLSLLNGGTILSLMSGFTIDGAFASTLLIVALLSLLVVFARVAEAAKQRLNDAPVTHLPTAIPHAFIALVAIIALHFLSALTLLVRYQ